MNFRLDMLGVIRKRPLCLQFTRVVASDQECEGLIAIKELIIIFGERLIQISTASVSLA